MSAEISEIIQGLNKFAKENNVECEKVMLTYAAKFQENIDNYIKLHGRVPENLLANKGISAYMRTVEFFSNDAIRAVKEYYGGD